MENGTTAQEWLEKGIALGRLGKHEEALDAFSKAIEIDPQFASAWNDKGVTFGRLGRHEEGLDVFSKAIEINPQYAGAWYNKGVALYELGRHQEALDAYNKAIEIDPQYADAWYNKGVALCDVGRYKEALDAFSKAIEIDPQDASAWNNKGVALDDLGRHEEALDAHNKAIEIDPQNASAWNNKGVALYELGRYEEALEAYNKAIEINPQYALAYSNLAEVCFDFGLLQETKSNADQAISLNETLTPALLLRGKVEIEEKDYTRANQSFTQAISSDPGNPIPLLWLTYAQYLKAESAHQPDSAMYQQEIAGIIRQLERIKKLVGKDNKLVEKDKDEARAYTLYFLGCFYYKTNDIFEAVRTLKKCVELKPRPSKKAKETLEQPSAYVLACELLDNIWNYAVRPPLWRWWWSSPLHCRLRRVFFSIISFSIIAPLAASPFTAAWLPTLRMEWGVYMFITTILLVVLALPSIQLIRARDIEVELRSPPPIEPVLSPAMFEMKLRELDPSP